MIDAAIRPDHNALVGLRSRKHIAPFSLIRPKTIDEACAAMQAGGSAAFMAGGLDLIDRMKHGETFERVIFLRDIAALHGIHCDDGRIIIGALATHADVKGSAVLAKAAPGLPSLWDQIANPRVRQTGTVGGNLMSGLPHYDVAPALLALGAQARLATGAGDECTVGIDALADQRGALLQSVSFDTAHALHLMAERSLHPALSVYLGARLSASAALLSARIAIGCAYARPHAIDLPVEGRSLRAVAGAAADLAGAAVDTLPAPIDDGLASSSYRRRMIAVLIRRLLVRLGATA